MTDSVISVRGLCKTYRLYSHPRYRLLDLLGLLRRHRGAWTEHAALRDVNLEIKAGERLGIIGRNGSGKSTLLKLIAQTIEPTRGTVRVTGKLCPLLQIGTGFHPELTGRANALSYLAHLGITGARAKQALDEIIDFAEVEEYIDQPLKTYSTGMGVRLMFATSTVVTPDILILDEVLGVGDAYFAAKSFERIRELCDRQGATVLLVSHDVYSTIRLCPRVVWLDGGGVVVDGDGQTVVKMYEDSIRRQEEERLRRKKLQRLQAIQEELRTQAPDFVMVEIRALGNEPQPAPTYFKAITLEQNGELLAQLPLHGENAAGELASHLLFEGACWGEPTIWRDQPCRAMQNYGSAHHKVAGVFAITNKPQESLAGLRLGIEYASPSPCNLQAVLIHGPTTLDLGPLPHPAEDWTTATLAPAANPGQATAPSLAGLGRVGSGIIAVSDVRTCNAHGAPTAFFTHGEPFKLQIDYTVADPAYDDCPQVLVAFHRDGVQDVCRTMTRALHLDARQQPAGTIELCWPELRLGKGVFTVTVMIAERGYYDKPQTLFYSLNPGVYTCLSRVCEIEVGGEKLMAQGTGFVADGAWTIKPAAALPAPLRQVA